MNKIIKISKWILVIGFILLAFLSIKYGFNNCSKCNFQYEDEKINYVDVWDIYMDKCLEEFTHKDGFLPLLNYTQVLNNT